MTGLRLVFEWLARGGCLICDGDDDVVVMVMVMVMVMVVVVLCYAVPCRAASRLRYRCIALPANHVAVAIAVVWLRWKLHVEPHYSDSVWSTSTCT